VPDPDTAPRPPQARRPDAAELLIQAIQQRHELLARRLAEVLVHRQGVEALQGFCATTLTEREGEEAAAWLQRQLVIPWLPGGGADGAGAEGFSAARAVDQALAAYAHSSEAAATLTAPAPATAPTSQGTAVPPSPRLPLAEPPLSRELASVPASAPAAPAVPASASGRSSETDRPPVLPAVPIPTASGAAAGFLQEPAPSAAGPRTGTPAAADSEPALSPVRQASVAEPAAAAPQAPIAAAVPDGPSDAIRTDPESVTGTAPAAEFPVAEAAADEVATDQIAAEVAAAAADQAEALSLTSTAPADTPAIPAPQSSVTEALSHDSAAAADPAGAAGEGIPAAATAAAEQSGIGAAETAASDSADRAAAASAVAGGPEVDGAAAAVSATADPAASDHPNGDAAVADGSVDETAEAAEPETPVVLVEPPEPLLRRAPRLAKVLLSQMRVLMRLCIEEVVDGFQHTPQGLEPRPLRPAPGPLAPLDATLPSVALQGLAARPAQRPSQPRPLLDSRIPSAASVSAAAVSGAATSAAAPSSSGSRAVARQRLRAQAPMAVSSLPRASRPAPAPPDLDDLRMWLPDPIQDLPRAC